MYGTLYKYFYVKKWCYLGSIEMCTFYNKQCIFYTDVVFWLKKYKKWALCKDKIRRALFTFSPHFIKTKEKCKWIFKSTVYYQYHKSRSVLNGVLVTRRIYMIFFLTIQFYRTCLERAFKQICICLTDKEGFTNVRR